MKLLRERFRSWAADMRPRLRQGLPFKILSYIYGAVSLVPMVRKFRTHMLRQCASA